VQNRLQTLKILEDLDKITRRISGSEVKEVAGFLFSDFEDEKDASDANDPFRAYLKNSYRMFSSLARIVGFNLEYIHQ
jgi:hypothetical protein